MTDRILIIEAEPSLRKGLISAFTEAGFAVANVPDYPEALLKIDEFKPNIIIMDALLPGRDGMEACAEFFGTLGIPVALLGENSSDEMWERVMEVGADLYQAKPFSYEVLLARVKAILRRYRLSALRSAEGPKMSREQGLNKGDSLLLSNEEGSDGFSVMCDDQHNITLLKCSKPVAWFSAAVPKEVLRAFLDLVKDRERDEKWAMQA